MTHLPIPPTPLAESEPLSGGWGGLSWKRVSTAGGCALFDVELPRSVLMLHFFGGRQVSLGKGSLQWRYRNRPRTFDFVSAGSYDRIAAGPQPANFLRIAISRPMEAAIRAEGGWSVALPTHVQFQDHRLEGQVGALLQADAQGTGGPAKARLAAAIVDRLFEVIAGEGRTEFTPLMRRLVVEHIDAQIASVDAGAVAQLTGLARTQFARMFSASFGMTLHQYVMQRRVQLASPRLRDGSRVTDLALELGFSSHAHFTTVFRKLTGMTPSRFRGHEGRAVVAPVSTAAPACPRGPALPAVLGCGRLAS